MNLDLYQTITDLYYPLALELFHTVVPCDENSVVSDHQYLEWKGAGVSH